MPITDLCPDILHDIMTLVVNACRQDRSTGFRRDDDHPCLDTDSSEALLTLIRLSHVNFAWRSLALLTGALWARNFHIKPNMSATLLEEIMERTGGQPTHLTVFDIPPEHPFWPQATKLLERCNTLRCQVKHYTHLMSILVNTPAPILESCAIFCDAPSQITGLWKPLFAGRAPALARLRLARTCGNGLSGPWLPHLSTISATGLLALGGMPHLTHLELNFPTDTLQYISIPSPFTDLASPVDLLHIEDLKLSGNPFALAHLLQAVALPSIKKISAVYTFSPDPILDAVVLVWEQLFRHLPSVDFPTFELHYGEGNCTIRLHHAQGKTLSVQFDERGLQTGTDEAAQLLLPFIHVPPTHINRSQITHGVAWMRLVSVPNFILSVKDVIVSAGSPNSSFPYHTHFLFSAMVAVKTLRFDNCSSACDPIWYDLLRDSTGVFGHPPLPNISTISLPFDSASKVLSNFGLHDLAWNRHDGSSPLRRVHFTSTSNTLKPDCSLLILRDISRALPVMVSLEIV